LIVEVADGSLDYDRQTKTPLYAASGVPEYWIVDVNGRAVEVDDELSAGHYARVRLYAFQEKLAPHPSRSSRSRSATFSSTFEARAKARLSTLW
jgi:hypothetical protein